MGKGIHSQFNACMHREECRRKAAEIEELRKIAQELVREIGWARGQFGSLSLTNDTNFANAATSGYDRMNDALVRYGARNQNLWQWDESGSCKPR